MLPLPVRPTNKPNAEINIVPYIDVMLVLLVIFMITTPILEQGVEIDLPVADSRVFDFEKIGNEPMVVSVNKKGAFSIGERENLSPNRMVAAVRAAKSIYPQLQVMVRGDKETAYSQIIQLIELLQLAGIEKVGLVTQASNQ